MYYLVCVLAKTKSYSKTINVNILGGQTLFEAQNSYGNEGIKLNYLVK